MGPDYDDVTNQTFSQWYEQKESSHKFSYIINNAKEKHLVSIVYDQWEDLRRRYGHLNIPASKFVSIQVL